MAGTIKLTIAPNGAVKSDMKGFKSCAQRTKEMLETMEAEATEITVDEGDEVVQTVSQDKVRVRNG